MGKLFFKKILYTYIIKNLRKGHNNLINDVEIVSICEVKLGSKPLHRIIGHHIKWGINAQFVKRFYLMNGLYQVNVRFIPRFTVSFDELFKARLTERFKVRLLKQWFIPWFFRRYHDPRNSLAVFVSEPMLVFLNETMNDSINDSMNDFINDSMHDSTND